MSRVRIPPTLREDTGGEREVNAQGRTVGDLLDDLTSRFPRLEGKLEFANVYVEGEDVRTLDGLDTTVSDDTTVILLPAMAGGACGGKPPGSPPLVRFADRRLTPPAGG